MKRNGLIILVHLLIFSGQYDIHCQPDNALDSCVPGNVINHLPASSGVFLGAPSIVVMPGGDYVVSHNYTSIQEGDRGNVHKTALFKSSNRGLNWDFLVEIDNQRWSTLFYMNGALYLIGVDKAFGNAVIRKSIDAGRTWTVPINERTGLLSKGRYHCAPVPMVVHNGRIWRAMEHAPRDREFRAFMMSVPVDADLLKADNWTFSNEIPYNENWYNGKMHSWLEGNAVVTPDNTIVNILRCEFSNDTHSKAAIVNISADGQRANFDPNNGFINLPGGAKKFTIRYDPKTQKYWSLVNWIQPMYLQYFGATIRANHIRNVLALISSEDLHDWIIERIVLYHPDIEKHAFQYVDWQFEGEDIIAVSRTAFDDGLGGANNYHDANFMTFHRIRDFRNNFNFDPPW